MNNNNNNNRFYQKKIFFSFVKYYHFRDNYINLIFLFHMSVFQLINLIYEKILRKN